MKNKLTHTRNRLPGRTCIGVPATLQKRLRDSNCEGRRDRARLAFMKLLARPVLVLVIASSLSGCLFKEPVYKEGFSKVDQSLGGVWAKEENDGDPRKMEFAVCAALDDDRYVLHHPTAEKGGIYYEARLLKIHDHTLLQLRV